MTLEEQIQAGIVPGSQDPEISVAPVELSEREKQEYEAEVIYDWDHLTSSKVRAKRAASKEYSDALDRVSEEDYPGCPITATFDKASGNYTFEGGDEAPAAAELGDTTDSRSCRALGRCSNRNPGSKQSVHQDCGRLRDSHRPSRRWWRAGFQSHYARGRDP